MFYILTVLIFLVVTGKSQSYAPQINFTGNNAIYKDSSIFIDWAKDVEVNRGYNNIAFPENGYADYGINENATGIADGNPGVISLGDGGTAILCFNFPIINNEGYDFAVFENGFIENDTSELAFLELAFVEVSTDGIEYVRFPAVSEVQTETQIGSFDNINARNINNFAGKYTMYYGTPFDLDDVENITNGTTVDINEINYIKIIDVTGTIEDEFASFDNEGNKVNDPYPTAFASGGFDLDAVGVINNSQNNVKNKGLIISPNPVENYLNFKTASSEINKVEIFTIEGKLLISTNRKYNIKVDNLEKGSYILMVSTNDKTFSGLFFK